MKNFLVLGNLEQFIIPEWVGGEENITHKPLDVRVALELTPGFFPVDFSGILSVYIINLTKYLRTTYTLLALIIQCLLFPNLWIHVLFRGFH